MAGLSAVCVGESMAVLVPAALRSTKNTGPMEDVATFHRGMGGAESNVARGLVSLGVPAAWVSRVGDDAFGRYVLASVAAAGVDTSAVAVDPVRPTGLYVKETAGGVTIPRYYRSGSAASALGPGLLDDPAAARLLEAADLVHLSGITAALSDDCLALLDALLARPRRGQSVVSFDLNWRPSLWRGRDPGLLRRLLLRLLDAADIVLVGSDEAAEVLGTGDPAELRELLPGPDTIVVKDGARAAIALCRTAPEGVDGVDGVVSEPALAVEVVEPMGAGDAFAAGFLAGTLRGLGLRERLRLGHLMAAGTLVVPDDHAPPPPPGLRARLLACSPEQWARIRVSAAGIDCPGLAGPLDGDS
ncbi:sugar kinase [Sphaerimonospora thailandensis]|uniref:Sugar kinase n=1 Tax=Sphaerimonospora thailandensis TaxID=795644 RepID=A0A8J3W0M2_9ACTN|nr:sugar kinase [Sphaerimonospora thailandensis]GIH71330.1 sugar kinase [Sphaerimonospora thailandensis]